MACLPGRPAASAQLPTGTGRRTPDNKSFSMRLPLACNLDRSRSHYQAALEHARLQQFCAARAEFESSIQSCPYFVRAWVSWAQVSLVAQRSRNNSTTRSDRGLWEVESGPCATLPADGEASEQVAAAGALGALALGAPALASMLSITLPCLILSPTFTAIALTMYIPMAKPKNVAF